MAEAHPVGFRWVMKAKERGATIIHVDPRFSRTSALADIWVPIRAGGDIAFLGGIVRHIVENNLFFRDYVVHFTNASCILREDFRDTDEGATGLFSGWDEQRRAYDKKTWAYDGHPDLSFPERDLTLQHPRCVFQTLRRHFARYTPEMVEKICGISPALFHKVADALVAASGPDKTAAICYALGWTQHSKGVQIIRTAAILQLLLGNIGRPGGGILALRGHASIQGSTDVSTLYDILPGYLPMPVFGADSHKLKDYINKHRVRIGLWSNFDAYIISLLKAYYGEAANKKNDYGFNWLPRVTGDHSHYGYWIDMQDGKVDGLFVMGQNPAVGAANGRFERTALSKLKWLVVRDLVEIETASFWLDSPEVQRGELSPETIGTEVFLFPAAGTAEKSGTFTNTQRLLQYRNKAVEPPGDSRNETWFMYHLGRRLKEKAKNDTRPRNAGLNALTWEYPVEGEHDDPQVDAVLKEINGKTFSDRRQLKHIQDLKNNGSTACGAWIYCGVYPEEGRNRANEREPKDLLGHGWGFSWPNDCRIIYNRASARPDGEPWSQRKKLVWWDKEKKEWTGLDNPDYKKDLAPDTPDDLDTGVGVTALGGAAVYAALGWRGMALCCERTERRTVAHALRTAGIGD